jgi:tetratricopeptide (TPR) repeat protein
MGRPAEEAVTQADWAIRLDPRSAPSVTHAAQVYMRVGRVDTSIEIYRRVLGTTDYWFAHHALGEAYTLKGLYREAIPEFEKAIALRGAMANTRGLLARAYAGAGEPERAWQIVADLEKGARTGEGASYPLVMAYLALGERERALGWLQRAYEQHGEIMMMLHRREFDPLRSDPRFQNLARRVGLPPRQ